MRRDPADFRGVTGQKLGGSPLSPMEWRAGAQSWGRGPARSPSRPTTRSSSAISSGRPRSSMSVPARRALPRPAGRQIPRSPSSTSRLRRQPPRANRTVQCLTPASSRACSSFATSGGRSCPSAWPRPITTAISPGASRIAGCSGVGRGLARARPRARPAAARSSSAAAPARPRAARSRGRTTTCRRAPSPRARSPRSRPGRPVRGRRRAPPRRPGSPALVAVEQRLYRARAADQLTGLGVEGDHVARKVVATAASFGPHTGWSASAVTAETVQRRPAAMSRHCSRALASSPASSTNVRTAATPPTVVG